MISHHSAVCLADEDKAEDVYGQHASKGWESSFLDPRPEAELFSKQLNDYVTWSETIQSFTVMGVLR